MGVPRWTLMPRLPCAQARKVYVQDRLREGGALVWRLLRAGAHFYVCGDAAHMAGAVEDALLDIIGSHQVTRVPSLHTLPSLPSCLEALGKPCMHLRGRGNALRDRHAAHR